jgi:hypothetical protein
VTFGRLKAAVPKMACTECGGSRSQAAMDVARLAGVAHELLADDKVGPRIEKSLGVSDLPDELEKLSDTAKTIQTDEGLNQANRAISKIRDLEHRGYKRTPDSPNPADAQKLIHNLLEPKELAETRVRQRADLAEQVTKFLRTLDKLDRQGFLKSASDH